jgi:adenosylmethionine-8-amino-7-oxononanoate aminotransferase
VSSLDINPHLRDSVKAQVRHFASDFAALDRAFPGAYPRMIVRAEGAYLYDDEGHRTLDAGVSLGVCQIGHGRASVARAVAEQIEQLDFVGLEAGYSHEPVARLAAELGPLLPMADPGFSFTSSGSEANDLAFKLARAYWRARGEGARFKIVSRANSYHGAGWGGLSATGSDSFRAPFEPILPGFVRTSQPSPGRCGYCRFGEGCTLACADDLARVIEREGASSVAAFIGEPVSIFGAVKVPHPDYWRRIREICDAYGVLLIADEVVTGFGRTGLMFASSHWGVEPDMVTMAKGLTSGYVPMGATAVGQRVQEVLGGTSLMHINTYAGHPVACAAALAALAITQSEALVANAAALEPVALSALDAIAAGTAHATRTSGLGLMTGIEVVVDEPRAELALEIRHALYARGVAVRAGVADGLAAVLFYPPLTVDEDAVRSGIAAIGEGLRDVGVL